MKKLFLIILVVCLVLPQPLMATGSETAKEHECELGKSKDGPTLEQLQKAAEAVTSICPKTKMDSSCMVCHTAPDWSLKEKEANVNRDFPLGPTMTLSPNGKTAYLLITTIVSAEVEQFFEYLTWHPDIDRAVFELMSPGGSLFDAWRIVGMMDYHKSRGLVIETRCFGFAAFAGFVIFANGTKGERFASENAELMWHELLNFAMFKVERPSGLEDEAKVLRHLQDNCSSYLAKRSNLTAKEWDAKVHKLDFWINGIQAIEYGISDGLP